MIVSLHSQSLDRRLTIAALVLLVLGGGLWWSTRPKIDPRLVGTWAAFNGDGQLPSGTIELKADGWGKTTFARGKSVEYHWSCSDGVLTMSFAPTISSARGFTQWLKRSFPYVFGNLYFDTCSQKIVEVTPDEIHFDNEGKGLTYRRIP